MRPVVLCFSGLDPSGGAGLQADIEAIAAVGAHAAVVCTALTHQDSQHVYGFEPVASELMMAQAESLLADLPIRAFKIGMLGSAAAVNAVFSVIAKHPKVPVVLDPVLAANSGDSLAQNDLIGALQARLKLATVITPNTLELLRLAEVGSREAAIQRLTELGSAAIFCTGGHEPGSDIINRLYIRGELTQQSSVPRLEGEYHGSGCTLASALAGFLAQGYPLASAATEAENYVSRALSHADIPHPDGQRMPRRVMTRHRPFHLSGLYAITDAQQGKRLLSDIEAVLRAGVRCVQYRDKSNDPTKRLQQARELTLLCEQYGATLLVNDDVELALRSQAHGVHLGQQDGSVSAARARLGREAIIGVTCHNRLDLALAAQQQGASYVGFGAIYNSPSKPAAQSCDLGVLCAAREQLRIPIVAIGGITPDNTADVIRAGAHAVAVISALWQAPSPFLQAQHFIREIYRYDD